MSEVVSLRPARRRRAGGYLSIWTNTLLGELATVTLEAGGAYMRLLCIYWDRGAPLPGDDRTLAQLSGAGARWRHIRPQLAHLFEVDEKHWRHAYLDHEIAYRAHRSATQARKADIRWARTRGPQERGGAT